MNVNTLHESETGGIDPANLSMPEAVFSPGAEPGLTPNGERRKVALLTGITGQDGSYLAEFLLEKVRPSVRGWMGVGGCTGRRALSHRVLRSCCVPAAPGRMNRVRLALITDHGAPIMHTHCTGLRGARRDPPLLHLQHAPHRAPLQGPPQRRCVRGL